MKMNEQDLKNILARNPQLTVSEAGDAARNYFSNTRQIPAKEPERRTPDALESVAEGEEARMVRPVVSFRFYRTRLLDVDALNPKDLLDGLVKAALIPGDKVGEIILEPLVQIKVSHRYQEETVITIRYENDPG